MAKKKTSGGLTGLERFGGTVFFVFYLLHHTSYLWRRGPPGIWRGSCWGAPSPRSCTARPITTDSSP